MELTTIEIILAAIILLSSGVALGITVSDLIDSLRPGPVEIVKIDEFAPNLPWIVKKQAS